MIPANRCSYRVAWSESDQLFVGLCDEYPNLICRDRDRTKAFDAIVDAVNHTIPRWQLAASVESMLVDLSSDYYFHKRSGNCYVIIGVSLRETDLEGLVHYARLEEAHPVKVVFCRPFYMFLEKFQTTSLEDE